MNFISCDAAYSLYPKATFKSGTALICKDVNDVRTESAIDKYRNRGWKIYDDIYDLDYKRDNTLSKNAGLVTDIVGQFPSTQPPLPNGSPLSKAPHL